MAYVDWQEDFKRKLVPAKEAVAAVKSGDRVVCTVGMEPLTLISALLERKGELEGVKVLVTAGRDLEWYHPGLEKVFAIETGYIVPVIQQMMQERRCDLYPGFAFFMYPWDFGEAAVLLTVVSPPDEHGYCSFGPSLWNKRAQIAQAGVVIAELSKNLVRTYGENYVHVSEIDYFVERVPTGRPPGQMDLRGRAEKGLSDVDKRISDNVASVIQGGDTLQIGVGGASEAVAWAGVLDSKRDLGWHSENTPRGIIRLVREGIINGSRKTLHRGKAVATAIIGDTKEELDFVNNNPLFELYSAEYVLNSRTIAAHDNMVAINGVVALDLTGQISAESIGTRLVSTVGGQLTFAIGAILSKGGRAISVLPATAGGGKVSRIVPRFESGAIVSLPRTLADIVITEYGIARLRGKTQRQRSQELIAIAAPGFRAELKREAEKAFWP